jgi:hypothetical protein
MANGRWHMEGGTSGNYGSNGKYGLRRSPGNSRSQIADSRMREGTKGTKGTKGTEGTEGEQMGDGKWQMADGRRDKWEL